MQGLKQREITLHNDFDKHVENTTAEPNSTLGFLRRNLNAYISNPQTKEEAYKTLVRPILEHGQTVWDTYTLCLGPGYILEMIPQRKPACYILHIEFRRYVN